VIAAVGSRIDRWHVATLPGPRLPPATHCRLVSRGRRGRTGDRAFPDVATAYRLRSIDCDEADRIVVFGSFLTVAAAVAARR